MTEPPALEALVWDVDGTLADTERDGHRVAFNRAFRDAGGPFAAWDWDEARYGDLLAVAGGPERVLHHWRAIDAAGAAAADAPARVAAVHALKTAHYVALVRGGAVALRPGVRRLIADARAAGLRLAIATTTTPANVEALLRHTLGPASPGWFACIAAAEADEPKKPAPDVYRRVLRTLGLPAEACVAFEDSAAGTEAAAGAGIATLVTRNAYTVAHRLPPVMADLDGLGEPACDARGRAVSPAGLVDWRGIVGLEDVRSWHRQWWQRATAAPDAA